MKLLTGRDLAKELGVHYQTIYNWTREGLIKPAHKMKNWHLFDLEKVKRELAKCGKLDL